MVITADREVIDRLRLAVDEPMVVFDAGECLILLPANRTTLKTDAVHNTVQYHVDNEEYPSLIAVDRTPEQAMREWDRAKAYGYAIYPAFPPKSDIETWKSEPRYAGNMSGWGEVQGSTTPLSAEGQDEVNRWFADPENAVPIEALHR